MVFGVMTTIYFIRLRGVIDRLVGLEYFYDSGIWRVLESKQHESMKCELQCLEFVIGYLFSDVKLS